VADPEQGRAVLDEAPGVERVSWPSTVTISDVALLPQESII